MTRVDKLNVVLSGAQELPMAPAYDYTPLQHIPSRSYCFHDIEVVLEHVVHERYAVNIV